MNIADLKAYRIEQFEFTNKSVPGTRMELENKFSYNVAYSKNNTCKGELRAETTDKNAPDNFHILIVMTGIFVIEPEAPKEKIHLETYDILYPFVKSAVAMITAEAGIPPVMLPYADISKQNIYRFERPVNGEAPADEN